MTSALHGYAVVVADLSHLGTGGLTVRNVELCIAYALLSGEISNHLRVSKILCCESEGL